MRKAGYKGAIEEELRRSIKITRYQSLKVSSTYAEWSAARKA